MGSGKPEAVQLSTSSSPSFAVIFESWRISGGTVNNAKDATNPQLASVPIHKLTDWITCSVFLIPGRKLLLYMSYIGICGPKGRGF